MGCGGHALVCEDLLTACGLRVHGHLSPEGAPSRLKCPRIGSDDMLGRLPPDQYILVNGIGSTDIPSLRRDVYLRAKSTGFSFLTLRHPAAIISGDAVIREGVQMMAGSIVQAGASLGENTIVNTGTIVEHDCLVGSHCHLAPRVTLCGEVRLGDMTHVGPGTVVLQGRSIDSESLIGAMTLVRKDLPAQSRVAGNPAKSLVAPEKRP
nr:acetyltransferase [Oscillatoria laete-virens]